MAFNPFHSFRKHQKSVFAVLVIVCMFVFILQFTAGADPVSRMMSWFGAKRGQGPAIITLNGTKVYETDLGQLSRERQMASSLVLNVANNAERPTNPNAMPTSKAAMLVLYARQVGVPPFGRIGTNEDLLDFMVWRHQADRLGITLTEADIRKTLDQLASRKLFGDKPFVQSQLVADLLGNSQKSTRGLTAEELLHAVTDEFRVLLAQEAILGHAPGVFGILNRMESGVPAITPGEFLQFYREQCSPMNVWMLPVDVKAYVAKAHELKPTPPSDEVLRRLYDDYKGVVPSPERDRPAFKEPERVKLEWVSAGAELPYFKQQARQRVALPPAFTMLGARAAVFASVGSQVGFGASIFGSIGSATPWLALSAAPNSYDRTLARYGEYAEKQRAAVLTSPELKTILHDRSLAHPTQLGSIAAAFTAGASLGTGALSTLSVAWGGAVGVSELDEWRNLRSAEVWLFGSALGVPPIGPLTPPISLGALAYRSKVNDFWEVRDRLLAEEETAEAATLLSKEIDDFSKELVKVKATPDKVRKLIDEAEKHGLQLGKTEKTLDKYKLEKDETPALKKLRDEYLESQNAPTKAEFFSGFVLQQVTGTYDPKEFHRLKGDTYLVWRTEYVPAREPKFAEVRDKVVNAWYSEEARNLARKQAEEWSAQARKLQKTLPAAEIIKQLREESKTEESFTLDGVARLVAKLTAVEGPRGKEYSAYTVDAKKIALPRPNMVDQLVKQLKDEGDSMVVSNQPEDIYYVAVRASHKHNPDADLVDFRDILNNTPERDQLWSTYLLPTKRRDYERMVLKQLRTDAGATLNENGEYELPEGIRPRGTADSSEGD